MAQLHSHIACRPQWLELDWVLAEACLGGQGHAPALPLAEQERLMSCCVKPVQPDLGVCL